MKHGKKYAEAAKQIDRATQYEVAEAVALVKKTAVAKFDETVEAHVRLGVDGRHADQQVRGAVVLPHGTGKSVRVLVFAKGDKLTEAENAGADQAVEDIKAGKIEYRLDKANIIHCPVGKASFSEEQLTENFDTLMEALVKAKPASAKGQYFKSVTLASTMGPGVKVNPQKYA